MYGTTQRQRRKTDAILNSLAQLIRRRDIAVAKWSNATARLRVFTAFYRQWTIRRRDIARYSGSTTCLTVRKFQCDFYRQLAIHSCDAA